MLAAALLLALVLLVSYVVLRARAAREPYYSGTCAARWLHARLEGCAGLTSAPPPL